MTDYVKTATEAGDHYLEALAATQEQFLKYVKAMGAWTPAAAPQALAVFGQGSGPSTSDVFEVNFTFAEKLLRQQHTFAERLLTPRPPA